MQDKFSFDFIFPTTNDAVYYIIKSVAANVAQDGNELYPPSAYKDHDDLDDDDFDIFQTRL